MENKNARMKDMGSAYIQMIAEAIVQFYGISWNLVLIVLLFYRKKVNEEINKWLVKNDSYNKI